MGRILLSLCLMAVSAWSQTITVTSPAAGAVWKQGETKNIQWTRQGETGVNVRIVLRAPGQTAAVLVIADPAPNSGSFTWTIPDSLPAGTYVIRVRSKTVDQATDDSGQFQIQEKSGGGGVLPFPFLRVREPGTGDNWPLGSTRTIEWTKHGAQPANVRIHLMDNALAHTVSVISDSAPNSGSFSWAIPDTLAVGTYRVRVASLDGAMHNAGGSFRISRSMLSSKVKAAPAPLLNINVFFPPEGTHMNIGEGMIVQWETVIPGPYFIDLMSEDGHTLITHLCEGAGNNIGGNKWIQGNIHPEINTRVILPTGYYRFKVRGASYGSGLGPKVHITGPQVEVLEQLLGTYKDRHSRRRIDEDNDVQPDSSAAFSVPDKARVGGDFRVEYYGWGSRKWVGFIFRSQVVFPIEQIDMSRRTLKDAWIYIQEVTERSGRIGDSCGVEPYPMPTARGWKVYGLTGPWSGPCIETPGYEVGEIPSHVNEHVIYITDLVRGWLDRSKPNHGLIIGSRFEPFPEWNCFLALSWYKVTLNMKFLKDKAS